ncbi:MAG: Oligoendopeptidase F, plasmid [Chlamydiae bacterium]|nr:Oligoendopeptidase F, plasmid [Chlamydiota bacterium]
MVISRDQVPKDDSWNVEALYPTFKDWQKEFVERFPEEKQPRWPEIASFKGRLGESTDTLKAAIECLLHIERTVEKLFTYAHLRHDEDIANDEHKAAYQQILGIYHDFAQESAWFEPEILTLSNDKIDNFLSSPELKEYRFHLEKILRIKKHTLSAEKEELLALAGNALQSPLKAFSAINDADFKFGKVSDSEGVEKEISHASYGIFIREQDRLLRKHAFTKYYAKYSEFENTLAELINGQVQSHLLNARARNYSSCLEAALFPNNIDPEVCHSLIQAVNSNIHTLHKYVDLRKKVLGLDELHLYDMYVPLTSEIDLKMSYEEAEEVIIDAVTPLGTDYQNAIRKGFLKERWVDRYENQNKRSGAYSSGCYDSMPYILMNYKGLLRDVFTLAHEAGHSMHSLLSHQNQPYHYCQYPIFLAEVASTFNEDLLTRTLLQKFQKKGEKIYLINQKIEDIRTTLFRQTMFAEFELLIHEYAEKNIPLTPTLLKEEFRKLNRKYYGDSVVIDPEIDIEWARIPHFYYNFYVYQYATGISAALTLSDRVVNGGDKEREDYLSFLKGGGSRYPIDLLELAGVNMRDPQPVQQAIKKFADLVDQLEDLLEPSDLALK